MPTREEQRRKHADYMRAYYHGNAEYREYLQEWCKDYYLRNREAILERVREYQHTHREEIRARKLVYNEANRQAVNATLNRGWHRRRARILTNGLVEAIGIEDLIARDRSICGLCRRSVMRKAASIDPIVPLSKGGSHIWANVQLAHLKCNRTRKAGLIPAQTRLLL